VGVGERKGVAVGVEVEAGGDVGAEVGAGVVEGDEVGEAVGPAETSKVTVFWRVNPPPVPVIVNALDPVGVVLAAVTVRVDVPEEVTVAGLKVPVASVGNPVTVRDTA
jgi:hypothetical protein